MKGVNFRQSAKSIDQLWLAEGLNTYTDKTTQLQLLARLDKNDNFSTKPSYTITAGSNNNEKLNKIEEILKPYKATSNKSISNNGKSNKKKRLEIKSKSLEILFELERREMEAAKRIQRFWRHYTLLLPLRYAVNCMLMARKIQKIARGFITRNYLRLWLHRRVEVTTLWQARARRIVSNKRFRNQFKKEVRYITKIQKFYRGFICRRKLLLQRQIAACRLIQRVWRGVVCRCTFDRIWLDRVVVPIQAKARRMLAIKKVRLIRRELNLAALIIQRKLRQWFAYRRVGERFISREVEYRQECIARMSTAIGWTEDELVKLAKRLNKAKLVVKVEATVNELYQKYGLIRQLQLDFVEMKMQSEALSPRSSQMGWFQTIAGDIKRLRERITSEKLSCIFDNVQEVNKLDALLERRVQDIEAMARLRNKLTKWKDGEEKNLQDIVFERRVVAKENARRMAIADEKRRWKVVNYTRSGKPDKKRRPGRPWDKAAYAGPEKATYSAAGVDLLAGNRQHGGDEKVPGSKESVDQTLSEYSLQVYLDQVAQYEKLLNPIAAIMSKFVGQGQDMGYGDEGVEFGGALAHLGAINLPRPKSSPAVIPALPPAIVERSLVTLPSAKSLKPTVSFSSKALSYKAPSSSFRVRKVGSAISVLSDLSMSIVEEDYEDDDSQYSESIQTVYTRQNASSFSLGGLQTSSSPLEYLKSSSSESSKPKSVGKSAVKRVKKSVVSAAIPWDMLDKLDAEKRKFEESREKTKANFSFGKR